MAANGRAPGVAGAADQPSAAAAPRGPSVRHSSPETSAWIVDAIQQYEKPLTLYVSRILHDIELARDVVQEAFLRLCVQPREAVEPHLAEWLYTVCRNKALDVRRKEKRMTELKDETSDSWASPDPSPGAAIEQADEASRAADLMEHLSDNQQEVLRLKFQHGLSYKEISRVTNLSVTNVGFLIHTGLKALRERMTQDPARPVT